MEGRARSERRSISGPEPGFGAAMRVLLGVALFLKRERRHWGLIRGCGGIAVDVLMILHIGCWSQ